MPEIQKHTIHQVVEDSSLMSLLIQSQYCTVYNQQFSIWQGHNKYLPSDYCCEVRPSNNRNWCYSKKKKRFATKCLALHLFLIPHCHQEEIAMSWNHESQRTVLQKYDSHVELSLQIGPLKYCRLYIVKDCISSFIGSNSIPLFRSALFLGRTWKDKAQLATASLSTCNNWWNS